MGYLVLLSLASSVVRNNQRTLLLPQVVTPVDAVISESTYGDTLLPSRKEQVRTFMGAIAQTLTGGGQVLIPSFALGRAQEITQLLHTAMSSGQLPKVPIHLDGLTRSITELYEGMLPFLPESLQNRTKSGGGPPFITGTVNLVKDRRERERIISSEDPAIVIASSGMLHAGASPQYARAWLPKAQNALFVVGYQDAESPGRRLLELQQGGEILLTDGKGGQELVSAYARVERFYLSAHADRGGLLGMIARYRPGKVVLTHGETGPRNHLARFLDTKHEVALPKAAEVVPLADNGQRRSAFISVRIKNIAALKERHARAQVEVNYDPEHHVLVVDLPKDLDGSLFASGQYSAEVVRGKLTRIQLKQRDSTGAKDDAPELTFEQV